MHKERAAFFFVYIREAHPIDGWVIPENELQGISFEDPKNYSQRLALASTACSVMHIKPSCLIDGLDDAVGNAYLAWPLRVVLVDATGTIAVLSNRNPASFATALGDVSRWFIQQIK